MRNDKHIFGILALLCLLLCGCDNRGRGTAPSSVPANGIQADLKIYGDMEGKESMKFWYAVDENTGVAYIIGSGYMEGFLTVALNADGTPVTEKQLNGWRWRNEDGTEVD